MWREKNKSQNAQEVDSAEKAPTPLWDAYYQKAQNLKFKNKWEEVRKKYLQQVGYPAHNL